MIHLPLLTFGACIPKGSPAKFEACELVGERVGRSSQSWIWEKCTFDAHVLVVRLRGNKIRNVKLGRGVYLSEIAAPIRRFIFEEKSMLAI